MQSARKHTTYKVRAICQSNFCHACTCVLRLVHWSALDSCGACINTACDRGVECILYFPSGIVVHLANTVLVVMHHPGHLLLSDSDHTLLAPEIQHPRTLGLGSYTLALWSDCLLLLNCRSLSQMPDGPALTLLKGMSKTNMRGIRNKSAWLNSQCKRITAQAR